MNTLGPAYNEFSYNEHRATTSNSFPRNKSLMIDINVKKSTYNEYHLQVHLQRVPLITSKFLWIKLLVAGPSVQGHLQIFLYLIYPLSQPHTGAENSSWFQYVGARCPHHLKSMTQKGARCQRNARYCRNVSASLRCQRLFDNGTTRHLFRRVRYARTIELDARYVYSELTHCASNSMPRTHEPPGEA